MLNTTSRSTELPVSVIIPAFNSQEFIREAIVSARWQNWPPAEIIVVNDGSTDATRAVAEAAGAFVIDQSHQGPAAARNTGVRAATQPWIAFLDADDVWEADKLEWQWGLVLACAGTGLVTCDHISFGESPAGAPPYLQTLAGWPPIDAYRVGDIGWRVSVTGDWFVRVGWVILPSTVLANKALLMEIGSFDERLLGVEDYECFARLLPRTVVGVVARPLLRYRLHSANLHLQPGVMERSYAVYRDIVLEAPARYPPCVVAAVRYTNAPYG